MAADGEVDQILETVVNNLLVTNKLDGIRGVRCRVLLTTPLESFVIGRTIVLSRGLLDVLPDEATLAAVLAHELAHIVRGDLWTNWLLLIARTLHWFNPVSWWTIREMQAEREAACDDLALAALGETDRSAYASTIVDLAANLAPSGVAPAMIGLIAQLAG